MTGAGVEWKHMKDDPSITRGDAESEEDLEGRRRRHRSYSLRITALIMAVSCLAFLAGIRFSGVELENLVWSSEVFDPKTNICLRTAWLNTTQGQNDQVQLCTEWIDHSDMSGETHTLPVDEMDIIRGVDGRIRTQLKRGINYRLVAVTAYLLIIVLGGLYVQRHLIRKYQKQMGLTP
jgi:hypothetical protein